jgi:hypothetical protein
MDRDPCQLLRTPFGRPRDLPGTSLHFPFIVHLPGAGKCAAYFRWSCAQFSAELAIRYLHESVRAAADGRETPPAALTPTSADSRP